MVGGNHLPERSKGMIGMMTKDNVEGVVIEDISLNLSIHVDDGDTYTSRMLSKHHLQR